VFYDGACPVCSREIGVYRRRCPPDTLELIDIAAPQFDAAAYGLDPAAVHKWLHVKLANGEIRTGIEAFRVIWRATPGMGWMAAVAGWPGIRHALSAAYRVFAANRHRLKRPQQ